MRVQILHYASAGYNLLADLSTQAPRSITQRLGNVYSSRMIPIALMSEMFTPAGPGAAINSPVSVRDSHTLICTYRIPVSSLQTAAKLPIELIISISEYLAGSHCYRSLAPLNVVSRAVHEETLPVMFETLIWDTREKWWILDRGRVPQGWGYVK